jgi:ABC-type phosphate/phosphonate transport system ATPase subunit
MTSHHHQRKRGHKVLIGGVTQYFTLFKKNKKKSEVFIWRHDYLKFKYIKWKQIFNSWSSNQNALIMGKNEEVKINDSYENEGKNGSANENS